MKKNNSHHGGSRKQQQPKPRNEPMAKGMLELRQGSRTTPVPSGKVYKRPSPGKRWV